MLGPPQSSRHWKHQIKQVSCSGSTDTRFHHTNCSCYCDLAPGICASLEILVCSMNLLYDLHSHMWMHEKKNACRNLFSYVGKEEIYCIFKTFCIFSVSVSTKFLLFRSLLIFCSNVIFFYEPCAKM